jgi:hypothetical protein
MVARIDIRMSLSSSYFFPHPQKRTNYRRFPPSVV